MAIRLALARLEIFGYVKVMNLIQFDYLKFRDVVHVIAERCPNDRLGRVKLHKTLYFSDMFSYVGTGRALTGAQYRKQPRGPMASALTRALADLQASAAIRIRREDYFGFDKDVFEVLRPADTARLSPAEIALLDEVIKFTCTDNSARTISELSHTMAWDSVPTGAIMPYAQAYLMFESDDDGEAEAWAEEQERALEAGPIRWLEPEAVGRFRARLRPGNSRSPDPR